MTLGPYHAYISGGKTNEVIIHPNLKFGQRHRHMHKE